MRHWAGVGGGALKRADSILSTSFSSERSFCCPSFRASGTVPGMILCSLVQSCPALRNCSPPGFSVHRIIPGKNTGVGCHSLLQGLFPTQGLNPGLLIWQADSLPLPHLGSSLAGGPWMNHKHHISFTSVPYCHAVEMYLSYIYRTQIVWKVGVIAMVICICDYHGLILK